MALSSRSFAVGAWLALTGFVGQTLLHPAVAADGSDSAGSTDQGSSDGSLGDSSAGSADGSVDSSELASTITVVSTVAAVVVLIVILVKKKKKKEAQRKKKKRNQRRRHAEGSDGDGLGRALLYGELARSRRDLGLTLNLLARSPSALGTLEAEARQGAGPLLAGLSATLQVPEAELAPALASTFATWGQPADQDAANLLVVRLLESAVEDFDADPAAAADALWRLDLEQARPDFPAHAPQHARFAAALGVPVDALAVAARAVLDQAAATAPGGSTRAALAAEPLAWVDRLADTVERGHTDAVEGRYGELVAVARAWDPTDQLGLGLVD